MLVVIGYLKPAILSPRNFYIQVLMSVLWVCTTVQRVLIVLILLAVSIAHAKKDTLVMVLIAQVSNSLLLKDIVF